MMKNNAKDENWFTKLSLKKKFAIIVISILILLAQITQVSTNYISGILHDVIHNEHPKVEAILEMEINVNEGSQNVLNYQSLKKAKDRIEFNDNVNDYLIYREKYGDKIETITEKNLLSELDSMFFLYRSTALDLFDLKNKQDDLFEHSSQLIKDSIDHILDDILQPSMANNSCPSKPCSSQVINICSNRASIACVWPLIKLAMVVK